MGHRSGFPGSDETTILETDSDVWSAWVLGDRTGKSQRSLSAPSRLLPSFRDRVIAGAELRPGGAVLDVGSGDGLVGFAALDAVGPTGSVTFADISWPLLEHCRSAAARIGALDRCAFAKTDAETLDQIEDCSMDAVLTRSSLAYVGNKKRALESFGRVLRPGGRVSLLEPIARYGWVERSQVYLLYDLSGLGELGTRLDAYFQEHDTSVTARLSFCERDLVLWAEQLGFRDVHLDFTIDIEPVAPMSWEQALHWRPNPCAPTLEEAMRAAFTSAERRVVSDQLRPLVEAGDAVHRRAIAHVVARKP